VELEVVQGLGVVRAPVLDEIGQHGGIETAAAARTPLEHDIRVGLDDAVHDAVETQHVAVRDFSLPPGGEYIGPEICDRAVDVPFHIIDIGAVQDPVDALDQVVLDFLAADIQGELVAAADCPSARDLHGPIGMCTEEVGIFGDHFRLKPDAEFHAQVIDPADKRRETAFDLFFVDIPVAQAGVVVIAFSEPSVIHDDHFDAHAFGGLCDLDELLIVKVEESCLPGVDQDGAPHIADKLASV